MSEYAEVPMWLPCDDQKRMDVSTFRGMHLRVEEVVRDHCWSWAVADPRSGHTESGAEIRRRAARDAAVGAASRYVDKHAADGPEMPQWQAESLARVDGILADVERFASSRKVGHYSPETVERGVTVGVWYDPDDNKVRVTAVRRIDEEPKDYSEVEALRAQLAAADAVLLCVDDADLTAAAKRVMGERDELKREVKSLRDEVHCIRGELSKVREVGVSLMQRLKEAHHSKQPWAPVYMGPGRQLAVCLDPVAKVWAIQGPDGWELADASWEVMAPWWLDPRERMRIRPPPEMYRG